MSDVFDQNDENELPDEDGDDSDEIDEELIADAAEFAARYGFSHDCRCAADWATGNLGVVSVCYLNMCRDAMDHLAATRGELADKDAEIAALRIELADRGLL